MISEKANKIADGCRFCWMCRHICPTGIATGREEFTPRARGLMVSMLKRGGAARRRHRRGVLLLCAVRILLERLRHRV